MAAACPAARDSDAHDCMEINLGPARIVAGRAGPSLQLVDVVIASIKPQLAGPLLKALACDLPLPNSLQHLKRVKPGGPALQILLCLMDDRSRAAVEGGGEAWAAWMAQHASPAAAAALADAAISRAAVPGQAPDTRDKHGAWNKIWPMYWRNGIEDVEVDGAPASAPDQAYFGRHMGALLAQAAAAGCSNMVLVIDPESDMVVARGADGCASHPLAHAAMTAMSAAAERDLALWPVNPFEHRGG